MRKPLLALAVSAFGIGTSEFIIMGLLPDLARSFHVSIPKTGILVSGYALSVTLGSPLVALALSRMDRKRALLILMGMFLAGNALCALAPTFLLLLFARILTALCHGAFFGIGSIVASHLVPRSERAQAIAIMFSGLTLANVLGVPAGTALGQAFGWRFAFWAIVPICLVAGIGLFRLVPHQPAEKIHLKHEFHAVIRPQVQLVLAMSTLSSVSLFCVFTYIAPILEQVTHLSPAAVTRVLVVFGVGITLGNLTRRQASGLEADAGAHWWNHAVDPDLPGDASAGNQSGARGAHGVCVGLHPLRRRSSSCKRGSWIRRRERRIWPRP